MSLHRGPTPPPTGPGQYWAMDFVHDQLFDGRKFRVLTGVDKWSRERALLEADFAFAGQSVAQTLEGLAAHRPMPQAITVDNGTEFTSKALDEWAWRTAACNSISFAPASRSKMASSNHSTAGCATSA